MDTLRFLLSTSFYPPYHLGGDANHVKYLAEELVKRGHEVHVIHSLDAYRIKRGRHIPVKQGVYPNNLYVHRIESPLRALDPLMAYTFGNAFYVQKKFAEAVKEIHPHLVHHHNISLLGYGILEKKSNYLTLYTAHDYWLICPTVNLLKNKKEICRKRDCFSCALKSGRPPQLWRAFKGFKTAIRSIDLMISPSDYVRRRLAQEIDMKIVTLPNCVPRPPENISSIDYSNYFLYVGMLEKHKGVLNLLDLFKQLKNDLNAKLIIAGAGSLKYYIQDFVEKNSLDDLISFVGFVNDKKLYSLYANALAVIIPSIWPENAPLVALEALSVGTPVIASNMGGLPEIIGKVDRKLIFDDLDRLKDILLNFSRKEFSTPEIKHIYEQNFSPEAYVDKYIQEIQSI